MGATERRRQLTGLDADAANTDALVQFQAAACRAGPVVHECIIRVLDYWEPEP